MKPWFKILLICGASGLFNATSIKVWAQETANYFKKIEIKKDTFKLVPSTDSAVHHLVVYPQNIPYLYSFQDSVLLLKSLLSFQGDSSISNVKPMNWSSSNPERTNYFVPDSSNYQAITIEIEALFIFNLIIEPKPFWLATYPRLQAKKIGSPGLDKMFSLYDKRIADIYKYYRSWLAKCEKAGTFNIGYFPLDNTGYSWL